MRKIELIYLEVLNETEQFIIFQTVFDKKPYGLDLTLNTALPAPVQDEKIRKIIERLSKINRKNVQKE